MSTHTEGMPAVTLAGVTKAFGTRRAVDDVSFELPRGAFLSIFGPNGAGKTTLLRMIATLARPTAGSIAINGVDAKEDPEGVRASLGFISHEPMLYGDMTPEENLVLYGKLYGVEHSEERAGALLEVVGLKHRRKDLVKTFSRGMVQRASIARALIHDPSLVLLDEPYAGLDPRGAEILDELIASIRHDRTFIMVSHDLAKGSELSTHRLVMAKGTIVAFGPKDGDGGGEGLAQLYGRAVGMGVA